ncbi:MAG TPA: hypothetical protein VFZ00_33855 [Solirubrobacter sp.]|nr:hypothetical protein [Solirubrobacter sp.]
MLALILFFATMLTLFVVGSGGPVATALAIVAWCAIVGAGAEMERRGHRR